MINALNFKRFDKGAMRGFFDLRYHGLTIKGCRLMAGQHGLWIALPQKQADENGEIKYYDQMYLTPPEADHVRRLVIDDLVAQGHVQRPAQNAQQRQRAPAPRSQAQAPGGYRTPDGEDLNQYRSDPNEDIPF